MKTQRNNIILVCYIMICAIIVFYRAAFTVLSGDALIYSFCLGSDFMTTTVGPHINSLKDVFISQYNQYFAINGRFLLHSITQIFAGLCDTVWFGIFDAIIIVLIFITFAKYALQFKRNSLVLTSLIVTVYIFYELEPSIINSIPHNINYLWPEPLILVYIITLKKVMNGQGRHSFAYLLLGFITGITQEVFVFPLCVTTLVIIIYKFYKYHRIDSRLLALVLPLWIGGATIGLAPGTMNRSSGGATSISLSFIASALLTMSQLIFLWGVGLLFILAMKKNKNRKEILWKVRTELCLFIVSFLFALVAHTTRCSYTGVSFFSILLIIALLGMGRVLPQLTESRRTINIVASIIGLAICTHQGLVAYDCVRVYNYNKSIIAQFCESNDNLVIATPPKRLPFTHYYNTDYSSAQPSKWICLYLTLWKDPRGKWPNIITPDEYQQLLALPDSLNMEGMADAYLLGRKLYVKGDPESSKREIEVTYEYDKSLFNVIRKKVMPSSLPIKTCYILDDNLAVKLPSGYFYPIYDEMVSRRRPINVKYVD